MPIMQITKTISLNAVSVEKGKSQINKRKEKIYSFHSFIPFIHSTRCYSYLMYLGYKHNSRPNLTSYGQPQVKLIGRSFTWHSTGFELKTSFEVPVCQNGLYQWAITLVETNYVVELSTWYLVVSWWALVEPAPISVTWWKPKTSVGPVL
jgi:hypothetical protein